MACRVAELSVSWPAWVLEVGTGPVGPATLVEYHLLENLLIYFKAGLGELLYSKTRPTKLDNLKMQLFRKLFARMLVFERGRGPGGSVRLPLNCVKRRYGAPPSVTLALLCVRFTRALLLVFGWISEVGVSVAGLKDHHTNMGKQAQVRKAKPDAGAVSGIAVGCACW